MPRLSSAAKKAAENVAVKLGENPITTSAHKPESASAIANTQTNITVPGLADFTPDKIEGMLPQFEEGRYQVSDPLNPPADMPQVSQQHYDRSEAIYAGANRALKLTGMAFDLSRERFTTIGKRVKAVGAGIKLATEVERVKGDFLDYLNQGEATKQKNISLGVSQHKTITDGQKAVFDTQSMDEKLEQSRIAAELASAQTQEKLSGLQEFQKQLIGQ